LNFRCIRGREPAGRGRNDVGEAVSGDKSEVGTHSQKRGPDEALPHAAHDSLLITLSIATQLLLNLTTCVRGPIKLLAVQQILLYLRLPCRTFYRYGNDGA
jgi:hypothetical protein